MKEDTLPCKFCKHFGINIHGPYCVLARYDDNGGYGPIWLGNSCIHDPYHKPLVSKFEPATIEQTGELQSEVLNLRGQVRELESENRSLRGLIK